MVMKSLVQIPRDLTYSYLVLFHLHHTLPQSTIIALREAQTIFLVCLIVAWNFNNTLAYVAHLKHFGIHRIGMKKKKETTEG